jgi:hypothetical protein
MIAYSCGKYLSPDAIAPYEHDGQDAYDVIDWISRQPWSNGAVGRRSRRQCSERLDEKCPAISDPGSAPGTAVASDPAAADHVLQNTMTPLSRPAVASAAWATACTG